MKILSLVVFMILLTGCGTVLTPRSKVVNINTQVPVEVWLNGEEMVSQGRVNTLRVNNRSRGRDDFLILRDPVNSKMEYRVELEKEFNRMTLLNLPFIFGIIGYPVDYLSGATGKLKRTSYEISELMEIDG